jgi:lipopolysaccharide biosynthesis glycosyltransferase
MKKIILALLCVGLLISFALAEKINVLVCFSENYTFQAEVLITSLLSSKSPNEHFNIYCFSPDSNLNTVSSLKKIVVSLDSKSKISFYKTPLFKDVKI